MLSACVWVERERERDSRRNTARERDGVGGRKVGESFPSIAMFMRVALV